MVNGETPEYYDTVSLEEGLTIIPIAQWTPIAELDEESEPFVIHKQTIKWRVYSKLC